MLSKKNIKKSEKISKYLFRFKKQISNKLNNQNLLQFYKNKINKLCDKIEYLEVRNVNNLSKKISKKNFKIFIAYKQNNIRLIDNF